MQLRTKALHKRAESITAPAAAVTASAAAAAVSAAAAAATAAASVATAAGAIHVLQLLPSSSEQRSCQHHLQTLHSCTAPLQV